MTTLQLCTLFDEVHFDDFDACETKSRKLSDVATAFDIDLSNAHQALDDTYAVAEIVAALTPVVGEELMFNNLFQSPGEPDPSGMFALRPA